MEHLSLDVLSRLVDEPPTVAERYHLDRCARCASELEALEHQTAALSALPDVRPVRGDWEALEARLIAQGLVQAAEVRPITSGGASGRWLRMRWLRHAASVALFATGATVGAAAARSGLGAQGDVSAAVPSVAQLAATTDPGEALALVQEAERAYIGALVHYRQLVGARGGDEVAGDPAVRYAALEQLVQAGQAAVSRAPADPFLNGLLASALAEQQAVYRRMSGAAAQDGWF